MASVITCDKAGVKATYTATAAAVTGGDYVLAATIKPSGRKGIMVIQGTIATSALTGLKLTASTAVDGAHTVLATDAEFLSANNIIQYASPGTGAGPHTTAANATFAIKLNTAGFAEFKLYGKSAGTCSITLSICSEE